MTHKDKERVIAALEEYKGDSIGLIAATIEDCQRVVMEMAEDLPTTNAERIRVMTDEELADTIMCPMEIGAASDLCANARGYSCIECSLQWLKEPAKEEHGR